MSEPTNTNAIPAALLAELNELRPLLLEQGSVLMRQDGDRRASFRLRFRQHDEAAGYEKHRSIPLPDQSTAGAVSVLLAGWREEVRQKAKREEQERREVREREKAEQAQHRELVELIVTLNGGKRRMRDRALRELKDAEKKGIQGLLEFGARSDWHEPGAPGRPPTRASIW